MANQAPTSKMAIAALVLSLLFCIPLAPLIGIVLAIVALVKISKSNGTLGGQTLAIIALCAGFFLLVANIGVMAAIAIPNFIRYQLRSKTSEARMNLGGLKTAQESFKVDRGAYATIAAAGGGEQMKVAWEDRPCPKACETDLTACTSFSCIGFAPYGQVYYRYACNAVQKEGVANFTCAAFADLDGDGTGKMFVYGTGEGNPVGMIVAPIPDLGDLGICTRSVPADQVYDCASYNY